MREGLEKGGGNKKKVERQGEAGKGEMGENDGVNFQIPQRFMSLLLY